MRVPPRQITLLTLFGILFLFAACQADPPSAATSPLAMTTPQAGSPLESPLTTNGRELVRFERPGETSETNFALEFDQTRWEYGDSHVYGPALGHHHLFGCTLVLNGWGGSEQGITLRTISLGGREWVVSATGYGYVLYRSSPFSFVLASYPEESLVDNHLCQQEAEQVIATLTSLPANTVQTTQVIGGSTANEEAWLTAHSRKGGFSVQYPASWEASETDYAALILVPPAGQRQDQIWFNYLGFEKSETEDLLPWLERYFALSFGPPQSPQLSPVQLTVRNSLDHSQAAYNEDRILGRDYYISHGRLVLLVSHSSQRVGQGEVLRRVADSIIFDEDAPTQLAKSGYPQPYTAHRTIDEYEQWMFDFQIALDAVNFRLQTGLEPTEQLAAMSEQARQEYERLAANAAEYIQQMDAQRAAQAAQSPLPTPEIELNGPESP